MPLSITRHVLTRGWSVELSEAENQLHRTHPERRRSGYDEAVAWSKGRDPMRPVYVYGDAAPIAEPPSGWRPLPARAGDLAKVAGYSGEPLGMYASVTGTSRPGQICAATSLAVCTGVVLGGTAVPGSSTSPSRVRALHALPASHAAPDTLRMALRVMRLEGLHVEAALAGGTRGDEVSERMNARLRQILLEEGVPIRFDDSLPDHSRGPTYGTVAAVVLPDGSIAFGNRVEVS